MSKGANRQYPVLEWSRSTVRLYDPSTNTTKVADGLESLDLPKQVILAVSRRSSFLRVAALPNARREDLRAIVALQLANHFPVPAHELSFDFLPLDEVTPEGRKVLIVGTRLQDLSAALDAIRSRGSEVVQAVPTALGSALLAQESGLASAAVLENSPEGIAIDLVEGTTTRISRLSATSGLGGLAGEIERSYQASGLSQGTVLATGNLDFAEADRKVVGTVLDSLSRGASSLPINLELPSEILKREQATGIRRSRMAALAAVGALLLGFLAWDEHDRAAQVVAKGDAKWAREIKRLNDLKKDYSADATKLTASTGTIDRAQKPAQRASDVLQTASDSAPAGVWLTGFNFERGKPVQIRGAAKTSEDVRAYLDALEANPRFRDVKLSFANQGRVDEVSIVQFSVAAMPVGNLPYTEPDKGKKKS